MMPATPEIASKPAAPTQSTLLNQPGARPVFDYSLEALRGIAALFVVFDHALNNGPTPDPAYHISGIWQYPSPAHLSVIVFFMLSGYVIGVANPRPIETAPARWLYMKKRLVRLYPLYLLALLAMFGVSVAFDAPYGVGTMASCVLFLQGIVVKVPAYNPVIWSLGYEILFYVLFLVVSAYQWRAIWVAAAFVAIGLAISLAHLSPIIMASYAYGAVFWFVGLALSKRPKTTEPLQYGTMLAFLLLMMSFQRMNLLYSIVYSLHLDVNEVRYPEWFDRAISFSDFTLLLYSVPLLLCFTNRAMPGRRLLEWAAFAMPGLYLGAYIYSGKIRQPELFNTVILAAGFYVLALAAYALRHRLAGWGEAVLEKLTPLGHISYGVYIIHYPLFFIFHKVGVFSGTATTFLVRLMLYLALVLVVGWVLERRLQPWVRKKLM